MGCKGRGHAALGQIDQAEAEERRFEEAFARVPETRLFFNYRYVDILAVAAEMLRGEIANRKGDHGRAFAHLAGLWRWMTGFAMTSRGAGCSRRGTHWAHCCSNRANAEEAAQVYAVDLGMDRGYRRVSRHPDNVWSLHGYVEALHRLVRYEEAGAIQPRLDLAMARADVDIRASCFCRLGDDCCAP